MNSLRELVIITTTNYSLSDAILQEAYLAVSIGSKSQIQCVQDIATFQLK